MYFVAVESKERDGGQKLGVDAMCVWWPATWGSVANGSAEE